MHLVIAIPTFNRCEKLKKNLEHFDKQQMPKNFKISVAISNSASTDHTEQFLNKLDMERSDFFIFNQQTNWTGGNYGFLEAILPEDADWIWYMGDDDYFPGTNSLIKMCEFLRKN